MFCSRCRVRELRIGGQELAGRQPVRRKPRHGADLLDREVMGACRILPRSVDAVLCHLPGFPAPTRRGSTVADAVAQANAVVTVAVGHLTEESTTRSNTGR